MSQTTAILVVAIVGVAVYLYCGMKNGKNPRFDDLLTFAMWCSAIVAGIYMLLSALNLTKQADEETKRTYIGIFGLVLTAWSFLKACEMIRTISVKKQQRQDKAPKEVGSDKETVHQ